MNRSALAILLAAAVVGACDRSPGKVEHERQYAAERAEGQKRLRAGPQLESIKPVDGGLEILTIAVPDSLFPEEPESDTRCYVLRDPAHGTLERLMCQDRYGDDPEEPLPEAPDGDYGPEP